jgi:hypothetical protein
MIYVLSFIKIGSGVQKLMGGGGGENKKKQKQFLKNNGKS